jgi:hypothetical protein
VLRQLRIRFSAVRGDRELDGAALVGNGGLAAARSKIADGEGVDDVGVEGGALYGAHGERQRLRSPVLPHEEPGEVER